MATTEQVSIIKVQTSDSEKNIKSLKAEMKDLTKKLQELALAGDKTSDTYKEVAARLGELKKVQREVSQDISEASTTFTNTVQYTAGALAGVSGAVQAVTGALSLMGIEADKDSKMMKILVGAMSITSGLQAIQGGVEAFKLLTTNIKRSTIATQGFNAAVKANPIGMVVTAITALIGVLGILISKGKEEIKVEKEKEEQHKKEIKERAAEMQSAYQEIAVLNSLIAIAKDVSKSYGDRQNAIAKINEMYPQLHAHLDNEKKDVIMVKQAYDELVKSIITKAVIAANEKKIGKLGEQLADLIEQKKEADKLVDEENARLAKDIVYQNNKRTMEKYGDGNGLGAAIKSAETQLRYLQGQQGSLQGEIERTKGKVQELVAANMELAKEVSKGISDGGAPTAKVEAKRYDDLEKRLNEIKLLKAQGYYDERLYTEKLGDIERERYSRIKKELGEVTEKIAGSKKPSQELLNKQVELQKAFDQQKITVAEIQSKLRDMPLEKLGETVIEIPIQLEPMEMELENNLDFVMSWRDRIKLIVGSASEVWESYGGAVSGIIANIQNLLGVMAGDDERSFEEQKKIKIASATISTIQGAVEAFMQSLATYGVPLGLAIGGTNAALVTATGIAQINQIKKTKKGSSGASPSTASTTALATNYSNVRLTDSIGGIYDLNNLESKIANQKVQVSVHEIIDAENQVRVTNKRNRF